MHAAKHLAIAGVIAVGGCKHAQRGGGAAAAPPPAPAPALAPADSTPAKAPVVALPQSPLPPRRFREGNIRTVNTFVPNVPLPSDSGECSPRERSPSGEGFTVMLFYPSRAAPVAVSIALLTSDDRLIRFTDRRGGLRLPPMPGLTRAQVDSAVVDFLRSVPRTTITLDYLTNRATVMNEGANRRSDGFAVPIDHIARHERYDSPDDRAHAIVARCR